MDHPREFDICYGRGKGRWNSPGNQRFKKILAEHLHRYADAPTKTTKSRVVESVMAEIKRLGGRFVKQNESDGKWYEIDLMDARSKVAHCIRDHLSNSQKRTTTKSVPSVSRQKRPATEDSDSSNQGQQTRLRSAQESLEAAAALTLSPHLFSGHNHPFDPNLASLGRCVVAGNDQSTERMLSANIGLQSSYYQGLLSQQQNTALQSNVLNQDDRHILENAVESYDTTKPSPGPFEVQSNQVGDSEATEWISQHRLQTVHSNQWNANSSIRSNLENTNVALAATAESNVGTHLARPWNSGAISTHREMGKPKAGHDEFGKIAANIQDKSDLWRREPILALGKKEEQQSVTGCDPGAKSKIQTEKQITEDNHMTFPSHLDLEPHAVFPPENFRHDST